MDKPTAAKTPAKIRLRILPFIFLAMSREPICDPMIAAMAKAMSENGFSDVRVPHLLESVDVRESPPAPEQQPVEAQAPTQILLLLEKTLRRSCQSKSL